MLILEVTTDPDTGSFLVKIPPEVTTTQLGEAMVGIFSAMADRGTDVFQVQTAMMQAAMSGPTPEPARGDTQENPAPG